MKDWLRRLTVAQWLAMQADRDGPPEPGEEARALGLYLAVCVALIGANFGTGESAYRLVMGEPSTDEVDRRVFWALGICFWYTAPVLLYTRLVMGLGLRDLGVSTRGLRRHAWIYLAGFAIVLPCVVAVSYTEHFQQAYPMLRLPRYTWADLLRWELAYAAQFFALELLFRGVMIHGPRRALGPWVIPAMVLPYMMIHFRKPLLECVGSIVAGTALGVVSYRTGSIFAGVLIHIAVAWSMDGLSLWQRGLLP